MFFKIRNIWERMIVNIDSYWDMIVNVMRYLIIFWKKKRIVIKYWYYKDFSKCIIDLLIMIRNILNCLY